MSGGAIATGGRSTDSAAIDLEVKKFWRDLLILKDSSASVGQFEAFQSCSKRLERLETLGYSRTQRNSMQIELYEELREGKRRAEFVQEFVSLQDVLTVKY